MVASTAPSASPHLRHTPNSRTRPLVHHVLFAMLPHRFAALVPWMNLEFGGHTRPRTYELIIDLRSELHDPQTIEPCGCPNYNLGLSPSSPCSERLDETFGAPRALHNDSPQARCHGPMDKPRDWQTHETQILRAHGDDSPDERQDWRKHTPQDQPGYMACRTNVDHWRELQDRRVIEPLGCPNYPLCLSPPSQCSGQLAKTFGAPAHRNDSPDVQRDRREHKTQNPLGYTVRRIVSAYNLLDHPAGDSEGDVTLLMQTRVHDLRQAFHDWKVDRMTELEESLFERDLGRNMASGLDRALNAGLERGSPPFRALRRFASTECGIFW